MKDKLQITPFMYVNIALREDMLLLITKPAAAGSDSLQMINNSSPLMKQSARKLVIFRPTFSPLTAVYLR